MEFAAKLVFLPLIMCASAFLISRLHRRVRHRRHLKQLQAVLAYGDLFARGREDCGDPAAEAHYSPR